MFCPVAVQIPGVPIRDICPVLRFGNVINKRLPHRGEVRRPGWPGGSAFLFPSRRRR